MCAVIELTPEKEDVWGSDGWNLNSPQRYTTSYGYETRDMEAFLRETDEFIIEIRGKFGIPDYLPICTLRTASKKFYTEETDPQEDASTETAR